MPTPVPLSAANSASLPDLTPCAIVPLDQRMAPAQQRQTLEPERDAGPEQAQQLADDTPAASATPLLAAGLVRSEQALALLRLQRAAGAAAAQLATARAGQLPSGQAQAAPSPAAALRAAPAAAAATTSSGSTAAAATATAEAPATASVVGQAEAVVTAVEPRGRRDADAANAAGSARDATPQPGAFARWQGDAADAPRASRPATPAAPAAPAWEAIRSAEASAAQARSQTAGNSGLTVNFSSWGEGHAVTASLAGQGVLLSPSSERVGAALADACVNESLRWRVARADEGADERHHDRRHALPEGETE